MTANDMQVGGGHYSTKGGYQHWDWCADVRLGYFESAATKYLSRHWDKNGVEDVKKAYHYVFKILELVDQERYANHSLHVSPRFEMRAYASERFTSFVKQAKIPLVERSIMGLLCAWQSDSDLNYVLKEIDTIIVDATGAPMVALELKPSTSTQTQPEASTRGMAGPFGYPGDG